MNTDKIYAEQLANEYAPKDTSKVVALRKLDAKAKLPATVFTYTFGIVAALIFGVGMCLAMGQIGGGTAGSFVFGMYVGVFPCNLDGRGSGPDKARKICYDEQQDCPQGCEEQSRRSLSRRPRFSRKRRHLSGDGAQFRLCRFPRRYGDSLRFGMVPFHGGILLGAGRIANLSDRLLPPPQSGSGAPLLSRGSAVFIPAESSHGRHDRAHGADKLRLFVSGTRY